MRILQLVHSVPFLNQAGTEIYTYNLSLELAKRHEVYIFSRICNIKQKEYEVTLQIINGIDVYLINNTFKYCNSFEKYYENSAIDKQFAELLDEIKPDIVHIQHLVFFSIGIIKEIKNRKIPIVFTLHDYWLMCPRWHLLRPNLNPCQKVYTSNFDEDCSSCLGEMLNINRGAKRGYLIFRQFLPNAVTTALKKIYFKYMRYINSDGHCIDMLQERVLKIKELIDLVDLFISPSNNARDKFIKFGISADKISCICNGVTKSSFMPIRKDRSNKLRFAFIGTILPAKGLHILIEAFNKINETDTQLRIYGRLYSYIGFEYYLRSLKKMIKNKNIKLMGEFNNAKIAEIFQEIDVLVVPSIWDENSPLVIQESFLYKTPVIASRIGGIPELICNDISGLLFTPGDKEELQRKMEYVINNSQVIDKLKDKLSRVKSIEDNAREMEEIYRKLIARNKYAS